MNDLRSWLEQLGLSKYASVFAEHEVDYEILPELSEQDLERLGLPLGPRKKILKALKNQATDGSEHATEASAPSASQPERRQLTVMFCDLVGSTALSVRFDPEDFRDIIQTYQNCCEGVIKDFDGFIARYMGDGLLVYFGYPQATEYDPERAVRAGLKVVTAVRKLQVHPNIALQTRVGIATGEVVVGEHIGAGMAREQAVVGEAPNLAARLQALAEPDAVVIADGTYRLIGGLFDYLDLGQHTLKGFDQPMQLWRVIAERPVESRFEATHTSAGLTPLIGRTAEVELLRERWRQARQGAGQVVLLTGEPGIGKSRLIQVLHAGVAGETHITLRHYCSPYYRNSALYPVINHLERAARFHRDDTPETKLDKLEALLAPATEQLAAAAPLVAALLSIPAGARYPPLNLSPQRQKEQTLVLLEEQLIGLTRRRPVLVIFEDLHWADPSTLELLQLLINGTPAQPLLVLLTYRPDFIPPWNDDPHLTTLSLQRLTPAQVTALVNKLSGGKTLPPAVLEQIIAKTDGIPLFVEELTKTLLEAHLLHDAGDRYTLDGALPSLAIPSTLQDSLMARLDRLSRVKEVAQVSAALGREFSYDLLAAVLTLDDTVLRDALARLCEAELIHPLGTKHYSFKHALVQDAAYNSLLRSKRRRLHTSIASVLEERFPETAATQPELLAHHYTGAGLTAPAIRYWRQAGQRAMERSANIEAVNHLHKGLELVNALPDTTERARQELALQASLGPVLIATQGWAAPAAGDAYARAQALCQRFEDTPQLFPALYGLWAFHLVRAEHETTEALGVRLLELGQRQQESALLIQGHWSLGCSRFFLGDIRSARQHLESVTTLYDPGRHRDLAFLYGHDPAMSSLCYLALSLWRLGYPDQALVRSQEALAHARALTHPFSLAYALTNVSMCSLLRGDIEAARALTEENVALCIEQGFPYFLAAGCIFLGGALVAGGEVEEGIERIRQGLADYRLTGAELAQPLFLAILAEALGKTGQAREGLTVLDEALAMVNKSGERDYEAELYRLKGELLLRAGRAADEQAAERCFQDAIERSRRQQTLSWELRASTDLARLWQRRGNRDQARGSLARVVDGFSEGLETSDLRRARALLEALG